MDSCACVPICMYTHAEEVGGEERWSAIRVSQLIRKLPDEFKLCLPAQPRFISDVVICCANRYGGLARSVEDYAREKCDGKRSWGGDRKNVFSMSQSDIRAVLVEVLVAKLDDTITCLNILPCGNEFKHPLWNAVHNASLVRNTRFQRAADRKFVVHSWCAMAEFIAEGLASDENLVETWEQRQCMEYIELQIACACSVSPDSTVLRDIISALCVGSVEPSQIFCQVFMLTNAMDTVLGKHLAKRLRDYLHTEMFSFPTRIDPSDNPSSSLLQELLATRTELNDLKRRMMPDMQMSYTVIGGMATGKQDTRLRSFDAHCKLTAAVKYVMNNKIGYKHAPSSLHEAANMLRRFSGFRSASDNDDAINQFISDPALRRHTARLDDAIDRTISSRVEQAYLNLISISLYQSTCKHIYIYQLASRPPPLCHELHVRDLRMHDSEVSFST